MRFFLNITDVPMTESRHQDLSVQFSKELFKQLSIKKMKRRTLAKANRLQARKSGHFRQKAFKQYLFLFLFYNPAYVFFFGFQYMIYSV